MWVQNNSIV
uniref:Uncharacterized protein n=1 Tax=Rhizophora mucronata TaxID=61149 RepID=A0A2P2MA62_RHIMU